MNPIYRKLIDKYNAAPNEFKATRYWRFYEGKIASDIERLDSSKLRSGRYRSFVHFGFNETIYRSMHQLSLIKRVLLNLLRKISSRISLCPYSLTLRNIRESAFHHCVLYGKLTQSKSITNYSASSFGGPVDIFNIGDNYYTMQSLNNYIRYCFINKHIGFKGDEILVELGSGAGHQIEVIKKLYPGITVLIFDLPAQLYLSNLFLTGSLGKDYIAPVEDTIEWVDLKNLHDGKIHFFGNWQFPLLSSFEFDLFLNSASFGEMERDVVKNYLSYIRGNANKIFLLNARSGKETTGENTVDRPIKFDDYCEYLTGYMLLGEEDAHYAHKKMDMSGGYFQAVWELSSSRNV